MSFRILILLILLIYSIYHFKPLITEKYIIPMTQDIYNNPQYNIYDEKYLYDKY